MLWVPALFTTASSRPNVSSAVVTMVSAPSSVATDATQATASPPPSVISPTTASAGALEPPLPSVSLPTSATTTRAPRAARSSACPRPMPRPAPVTITTRPSNRKVSILFSCLRRHPRCTPARLGRQARRGTVARVTSVVVLGAGFAGLELSTRLSEELGDDAEVVLIDQSDGFVFGFSKLDVMFGRTTAEAVFHPYRDVVKPGVRFVRADIDAIDPTNKRVETSAGPFEGDVLVVALGADLDPGATPGLVEGGHEFYTEAGAFALRDVLAAFDGGRVVIGVTRPPFKCPPAPSETALLVHDLLVQRGVRDRSEVSLVMPLPVPIPPSPEASQALIATFTERGIGWFPERGVRALDPDRRVVVLTDDSELPYDLFLGIPVHVAPPVVVEAGMCVDGWIPVDPYTLETSFADVYAVGDVTSVGTPKAGVFSEGQARWSPTRSSPVTAAVTPRPTTVAASATSSSATARSARSTSRSSPARRRSACSTVRRGSSPTTKRRSARAHPALVRPGVDELLIPRAELRDWRTRVASSTGRASGSLLLPLTLLFRALTPTRWHPRCDDGATRRPGHVQGRERPPHDRPCLVVLVHVSSVVVEVSAVDLRPAPLGTASRDPLEARASRCTACAVSPSSPRAVAPCGATGRLAPRRPSALARVRPSLHVVFRRPLCQLFLTSLVGLGKAPASPISAACSGVKGGRGGAFIARSITSSCVGGLRSVTFSPR